jgi:hypothetical protein
MKKFILLFLGAFLILGCSSIKISYDYDNQSDFSKFKTYSYSEDALKLPIQELDRDRLIRAIDKEMTAKGFTKSEQADVWIDLAINTATKRTATATNVSPGYYGRPWRYGYGTGFSTTQIDVNEYVEGTLFINMVDASTEKIVWQGRGTKTLSENNSPQKREAAINEAVNKIFTKYPPK